MIKLFPKKVTKMQILDQKEEKLFNRKEVNFKVNFDRVTPNKEDLKKQISEKLKVDPELVVIEKAHQHFGERTVEVSALIYSDKEFMKKVEIRNKKVKKEAKKEPPK